ncbi:MAG: HEAT repeat domain-containing protein [Planctomycetota bacterium]|jgi:hypothetical protein
MKRRIFLLFVMTLLAIGQGCMYPQSNEAEPLKNPPPKGAEPSQIRENIHKLGENLNPVELKVVLNNLISVVKYAEPFLFEALKDKNARRRTNAVYVLRYSRNPEVPAHIAPLLKDPISEVALEAASVLADLGHKAGIPQLLRGLRHESLHVRTECLRVLRANTKRYFGYHPNDPKDRRDFSAKKWEAWWKKEGEDLQLIPIWQR